MSEHWSQEVFDRWRADDGDYELRLKSHDLGRTPVIVDLGAFQGDGTATLRRHWPKATIYAIEPIPTFFNGLLHRFQNDPHTFCFNYALGREETTALASIDGYGTNIVDGRGDTEISVVKIEDFLTYVAPSIDLMEINIEGAEYDLLEHMLSRAWMVSSIKNLQIQFHDVVPNAYQRMCAIREQLAWTHTQTYCYDFVFENWRLK